MCKGTIEEYLCLLGMAGDFRCPWRDPCTGIVSPFFSNWRYSRVECCGDHTSDCVDCPLTYSSAERVQVWTLECDECKARIQPEQDATQAQRLEFLAYLDGRRRTAMPRLQADIDAGRTNLTMEQLLWEDGTQAESEHVARAVWEADVERAIEETRLEEEAAKAQDQAFTWSDWVK